MGQTKLYLSSILILLLGFFSTQPSPTGLLVQDSSTISYDLTHDGAITSADVQEIITLASSGVYSMEADFNKDGVIDQLDIDLLTNYLS